MVNETIPVLINHIKRLLELLDLILVKHGKDIGSGPLGPLLGARPAGGFSTRHGGGWWAFKKPGSRGATRHTTPRANLIIDSQFKILVFFKSPDRHK